MAVSPLGSGRSGSRLRPRTGVGSTRMATSAGTGRLWVACAGCRCWEGHDLAGRAADGIGSAPVLTHHEQLRIGAPAERARKRAPVELDRREYLAAFADPHTVLVADIGEPDR